MVTIAFVQIIIRLHQLLLKLYPAAFRQEFGAEMTAVFVEAVTEAAAKNHLRLLILCGRELRDFPLSLIREYRRQFSLMDQQRMSTLKKRAIYLSIFIVLTVGWRLFAGTYFDELRAIGLFGSAFLLVFGYLPVVLTLLIFMTWILTWPVVWALSPVMGKTGSSLWFAAGLLNLAALFLPASLLIAVYADQTVEPFGFQAGFTTLLILTAALVASPSLFYLSMNRYQQWQQAIKNITNGSESSNKRLKQTAVIFLGLSLVLFLKALHSFYWFIMWDSTVDSLDYLWLAIPFLVLLVSGAVLFHISSGNTRRILLIYSLLMPVVLIIMTGQVRRVDFRQLTEAQAERVSQAIADYHERYGRYPQNLNQLTPRFLISLPEPVIIYGQTWCYEAADDYFRLGYVNREHWSNPRLSGTLYQAVGNLPELPSLCQAEVVAIKNRYPDYPYTYWTINE